MTKYADTAPAWLGELRQRLNAEKKQAKAVIRRGKDRQHQQFLTWFANSLEREEDTMESGYLFDMQVEIVAPTREEIIAGRTGNGGWKRSVLAKWGVPWPPPKGWRARLEQAADARAAGADGAVDGAGERRPVAQAEFCERFSHLYRRGER